MERKYTPGRSGRHHNTPQAGRGRGGRCRSEYQPNKQQFRPQEMKFSPYGQAGSKSPMTFDTVKEHILNTIQRTYRHGKDVVDSLSDMEEIDLRNF